MKKKIINQMIIAILLSIFLILTVYAIEPSTSLEPIADGPFKPDWESLKQYQCPDWFRDAKFGLWANCEPQGAAEAGDWYAQRMYREGSEQYKYHLAHYGHPSEFGYKDLCNSWKAEKFDPEKLIALYKRAGAQYFVALANHHDNFDCYDSKYQPWNSVNIGPKKDIVGMWAKAARTAGLRFGVSNHSSHAWWWLDVAYGHDVTGPKAGIPYDGWMTKADGKGKWWEGYDPQDLYTGLHTVDPRSITDPAEYKKWLDAATKWKNTSPPNDRAYVDKWYNRTVDLINKYHPDLLYFDNIGLPLEDAGLKVAAHFYNDSVKRNNGKVDVVLTTKGVEDDRRKAVVLDIERKRSDMLLPNPWQTDTCIGHWHYDRSIFENHQYTSADTIIKELVDIVSKNGNLLLSIPVRADGTIDEDEIAIVTAIGDWMQINKEAIFGTRPFAVCGEGSTQIKDNKSAEQKKSYTAEDIRFTTKGDTLYAILLGWPGNFTTVTIRSLAESKLPAKIQSVQMLGYDGPIEFNRDNEGLKVKMPGKKPCDHAIVLKIR